jgi:hypothetical protein
MKRKEFMNYREEIIYRTVVKIEWSSNQIIRLLTDIADKELEIKNNTEDINDLRESIIEMETFLKKMEVSFDKEKNEYIFLDRMGGEDVLKEKE